MHPGSVKNKKTDCEFPTTYSSICWRPLNVTFDADWLLSLLSAASRFDDVPPMPDSAATHCFSYFTGIGHSPGNVCTSTPLLERVAVDDDVGSSLSEKNLRNWRCRSRLTFAGRAVLETTGARPVRMSNSSLVTYTDSSRTPSGSWSTNNNRHTGFDSAHGQSFAQFKYNAAQQTPAVDEKHSKLREIKEKLIGL
jgi:hypothetical protein